MPDEARRLTARGREDVRRMAEHLGTLGRRPARLFASPLVRARETAEEFARIWGLSIEFVDWLCPGVPPSRTLEELRGLQPADLALVGHMPNLGLLLGLLTWGLPPKEVAIAKGGVALLKIAALEPGDAVPRWLLTPDALGRE